MPDDLLAELLAQERELVLESFDNDDAWELGSMLVAAARAGSHGVTVDIRRGEQQLFHAALDGTSADNDAWIERKSNVVRRFGHSSFYVGRECEAAGASLEDRFFVDPREYSAHGGAFPIAVRGAGMVGTVTVSGLPQADDHRLVVAVLRDFARSRGARRGG
ncbi:MAG: hypothetical protein AVDCRST_MAG38-33 [uncultured Solirubrobacteraceae bacterium]|uniref:UPF0303 protein AVDCRST_MAG38-33 n=1 Tax=uncultured Solirubrobacteraceae bacterium TaxID=1162706 RepID=A0A6J4R8X6_9ACTN|nr:MAG: hypothetical protein AVDCRST_MAG38-33 [uncultured Solirubrobacteraceae bacterium]